MARLEDKIAEIADTKLRQAIAEEVGKLKKRTRFGLVFEEHQPEVAPLFNKRVKRGERVAKKTGNLADIYRVMSVSDGLAECVKDKDPSIRESFSVEQLVVVRRIGEAIYPALTPVDSVYNGDAGAPHHVLIEADNFHALQLLLFPYAGKVDCIYIDPPYNTGARDWKYNNNYVDGNDAWQHSKWLTFMAKRLRLAKQLLNPETGVMIVTIDEHEVHHLGCLLEQEFPEAYVQMATIVINQKGVSQGRLARTEEYALFVFMPQAYLKTHHDDLLSPDRSNEKRFMTPRWEWLLRGGTNSKREDRPKLFFPIYVDPVRRAITGIGDPIPLEEMPNLDSVDDGTVAWPIRTDGSFGNWQVSPPSLRELWELGFVRLGGFDKKRKTWTVQYLNRGTRARIERGEIKVVGHDPITKSVNLEYSGNEAKRRNIKTVWHRGTHDSGIYGSSVLRSILGGESKFSFPKSIYAVRDALAAVVRDNPNALILDFFAGSGTTLNAVNLLNASDDGQRQAIIVTNNEVSEDEARALTEQGLQPGQDEWDQNGICRSVTWPRNKFTIVGKRDDGTPLPGEYFTGRTITQGKARNIRQLGFVEGRTLTLPQRKQLAGLMPLIPQSKLEAEAAWFLNDDVPASVLWNIQQAENWLEALASADHLTDIYVVTTETKVFNTIKERLQEVLGQLTVEEEEKRPFSAGFPANLDYFRLDFLEPAEIQMGRQFGAILPILWMMAGARGPRPATPEAHSPWLIPDECPFAVLLQESRFMEFVRKIDGRDDLTHIFVVTNSRDAYHKLKEELPAPRVVQLYKDYLENFKINLSEEQ